MKLGRALFTYSKFYIPPFLTIKTRVIFRSQEQRIVELIYQVYYLLNQKKHFKY